METTGEKARIARWTGYLRTCLLYSKKATRSLHFVKSWQPVRETRFRGKRVQARWTMRLSNLTRSREYSITRFFFRISKRNFRNTFSHDETFKRCKKKRFPRFDRAPWLFFQLSPSSTRPTSRGPLLGHVPLSARTDLIISCKKRHPGIFSSIV